MIDERLVELIAAEISRQLRPPAAPGPGASEPEAAERPEESAPPEDLVSPAAKGRVLLEHPQDPEALARMKKRTPARIGAGRAGSRLTTRALLQLRADHAKARDAVFADVDPAVLERLGLFTVQTMCPDKNTFLTRPDLGRTLSPEAVERLTASCEREPDVQIYAADGLSSTAIEANLERILPVLTESLTQRGLRLGTPFFLRFGRVGAQDQVAELLGAKVVCVLLGERPGLATAESMSAYIAYNARVGMPEARRTVVSNIHKNGLTAVEAGAYIAEVIEKILRQKASGVDLVK